jgi:hypothetical protein
MALQLLSALSGSEMTPSPLEWHWSFTDDGIPRSASSRSHFGGVPIPPLLVKLDPALALAPALSTGRGSPR